MPLSFTITEIISLPTNIPGGALPEEEVGLVFPSVYGSQNINFNANVVFVDGTEESPITYPISELLTIKEFPNNGISISILSTQTIKISGNIVNVFDGEYYRFLLRDGSTADLPPDNNADWVSLIGWGRPNSFRTELEYKFLIKYETAPSTTVTTTATITQEVFWSLDSSLNRFSQLLSQGEF